MDLLVDIIVLIVKALTKPKQPQFPSLTPQQAAAQQAAMQQRLLAAQQAMAAQQGRVRPGKAIRPGVAAKPAAPARAPVARQPLSSTTTATTEPRGASVQRLPASGLLVPLILGEVLAPPLALREPEL